MASSIPFFSIILFVFLIPAVSYKITGKPFKSIFCCIKSLVVPGKSVTIDVFNFVNALIKLLLPALGFPIIVTVNPSLIKEANFAEFIESLIYEIYFRFLFFL